MDNRLTDSFDKFNWAIGSFISVYWFYLFGSIQMGSIRPFNEENNYIRWKNLDTYYGLNWIERMLELDLVIDDSFDYSNSFSFFHDCIGRITYRGMVGHGSSFSIW